MSQHRRALFVFRRDLRLHDNTALIAALENCPEVLTLFVVDPNLVRREKTFAQEFLYQSLLQLQQAISERGGKLLIQSGDPVEVIATLIAEENVDALYINRDYTPYAKKRDQGLAEICASTGVGFYSYADQLLTEPEAVEKKSGGPYTVYTPFFKSARQHPVPEPRSCQEKGLVVPRVMQSEELLPSLFMLGECAFYDEQNAGRLSAIGILRAMEDLELYEEERNTPALEATSGLAPHLKFGTCSVREAYHGVAKKFGQQHALIGELFWRDFFTHIGFNFPHVFTRSFREKYDALTWTGTAGQFSAWCEGRTGFPIVDAGMRQLLATGTMHNRVRMIVASFLVKDLHIDWRLGEKWFAENLVDYDKCVNNGNWQWVASTGCDAQPWFRIFNPWRQQKTFDPDAAYIKRWIPELADTSIKEVHSETRKPVNNYPAPLLCHKAEAEITKTLYGEAA